MRSIFMDTVGLIALWDNTDQWHVPASNALAKLYPTEIALVTTSFVLLECGNAAARRPYRFLVDQMRSKLIEGGKLISPSEIDQNEAWSNYRRGQPGDAGVVDHMSFVVMRRLGITEAFTNDRHFKAEGFNTLF